MTEMTHADWVKIGMFRRLDPEQETEFREWARGWNADHPTEAPSVLWHPIVHDEISRLREAMTPEVTLADRDRRELADLDDADAAGRFRFEGDPQ